MFIYRGIEDASDGGQQGRIGGCVSMVGGGAFGGGLHGRFFLAGLSAGPLMVVDYLFVEGAGRCCDSTAAISCSDGLKPIFAGLRPKRGRHVPLPASSFRVPVELKTLFAKLFFVGLCVSLYPQPGADQPQLDRRIVEDARGNDLCHLVHDTLFGGLPIVIGVNVAGVVGVLFTVAAFEGGFIGSVDLLHDDCATTWTVWVPAHRQVLIGGLDFRDFHAWGEISGFHG